MAKKSPKMPAQTAAPAQTLELPEAKAARFAALKRTAAPLLAELRKLDEDLKDFFRAHPEVNHVGEVGFSVTQRTQLDTKGLRAHLGDAIARFEKLGPVETLSLLRSAPG